MFFFWGGGGENLILTTLCSKQIRLNEVKSQIISDIPSAKDSAFGCFWYVLKIELGPFGAVEQIHHFGMAESIASFGSQYLGTSSVPFFR